MDGGRGLWGRSVHLSGGFFPCGGRGRRIGSLFGLLLLPVDAHRRVHGRFELPLLRPAEPRHFVPDRQGQNKSLQPVGVARYLLCRALSRPSPLVKDLEASSLGQRGIWQFLPEERGLYEEAF
jgi:hypothetical protein